MVKSGLIGFLVLMMPCMVWCQPLNIAVPQDGYPPYIIVEGKVVSGIMIEVLQVPAKEHGYQIQYLFMPEKRSLAQLKKKHIDARLESPAWVDRPQDFYWSDPIIEITDRFVFNKNTANRFENDDDLVGTDVVTHLGYGYPTLQAMFDKKRITRRDFKNEYSMLSSLLIADDRRQRAAVMDFHVARWFMKRHPKFQQELMFSERIVDTMPVHFQFSKTKKMKVFSQQLNSYADKIRKDGTLHHIIMKTLD